MLTTYKMTTSDKILKLAIDNAVDLWIFKELFVGTHNNGYTRYIELWKDISRIKLKEQQFNELKELLERYIKEEQ